MSTTRITDLTELAETPADGDMLVLEDISAGTTKKVTSAHVRAGLATSAGLSDEVAARAAHEAAANPHSGSASTTDLATVGAAVATHAARTDNPHGATATQVGAIPATSGAATPYVSAASETAAGISELATLAEAVTGTDMVRVPPVAAARQSMLSLVRDSLGKFPGIIPPSLNLFCGDATSDTAPAGTFTRSTTGTRLGQTGLIETVAAASVRREWGTDGALRGWLFEESRTNLITYSEQFDNAAWTKTRSTVTANATTAPDGTTTSDKIIEDSSSSTTHLIRENITVPSGQTVTFSVFVKAEERRFVHVGLINPSSPYQSFRVGVNLSTGIYNFFQEAGATGGSVVVTPYPKNWYRISITGAITDVTTVTGVVYGATDATASGNTYTGDGTSGFYVWGAQLESGPFPTSYISTTSSAVARSADVWTIPLATSWFNAAAGTLFVAGRTAKGVTSGANQHMVQYDDDTGLTRFVVFRSPQRVLTCFVIVAGVTSAALALGTVADSTTFRVAFSWSSSWFSASLNGGTCVTAAAATLPTGLTTHRVGGSLSGASAYGGHVLHDVYFPVALSDTQLQAITL